MFVCDKKSSTTFSTTSVNGTTASAATTTATSATVGFFRTSDGAAILALLVLIFMLLLALPVVIYILVRRLCWIKVHPEGTGKWQTGPLPTHEDLSKETQTDVIGIELEEFYKRRQPTDMSKYFGKELPEIAEQSRWHQLNPKNWNDPWSTKHTGKETNYVNRVF